MSHFFFRILIATFVAGSLAACRSTPTTSQPAQVSADTWAVVNGREIKRDEVEKAYRRTVDSSPTTTQEEILAAKLSLLDDLIIQEILTAKARELKIELSDTEIDNKYAEAKKDITEAAFQQELTNRNLTPADMREGLRREMLSQKVFEREISSKITVTDQEISEFFNANRAQFNLPEDAYQIAQIVITPVADPQIANRTGDDATSPQAAAAKTRMLMDRLKAGAAFRELAMDFSEDPESAPRGGDLGLIPVSRLMQAPEALRNAVVKKEPGTVNVVSANGGHSIVLVAGFQKAGQRDLSMPEVRSGISDSIRARKEQLMRSAYLTALRTDADVTNYLARRLVESQGKMPALGPTK